MKKVMAIMLAIVMCVGVVATGVCANAASGDKYSVIACPKCNQKLIYNDTKHRVELTSGYRCTHTRDDDKDGYIYTPTITNQTSNNISNIIGACVLVPEKYTDSIKIIVTNTIPKNYCPKNLAYSSIVGLYVPSNKTIYVKPTCNYNYSAVIHEYAHAQFYDSTFESYVWKNYKTQVASLLDYALTDKHECVAVLVQYAYSSNATAISILNKAVNGYGASKMRGLI